LTHGTQAKWAEGCQTGAPVDRRPSPPLPLFAALSLGLHLAVAVEASHAGTASKPAFELAAQTLAGDTLEVDPPPAPVMEPETAAGDPGGPASLSPPQPTKAPQRSAFAPTVGRSLGAKGAVAAAPVATFGAVGVRYATDLAATFTRAFPQAASADAIWSTAPFGSAGLAEVTLVLDEEGRLSGSAIAGTPSPALRRGIERTLAILGSRAFTSSAPSTRLRVTARVARDDVHDGLHGDVFALSGGSFAGDVGTAFFALPPGAGPGRRVDVELRLLP
jgi:hypothetical protein